MILAGDVGGTKVHLALYNFADGRLAPVRDHKFPAGEFASLDDVVKAFFAQQDGKEVAQVVAACFGCPGPVRDGRLKLTNLPWELDQRLLAKSLGIEHIFLINDLEANGYGIPELAPEAVFTLYAGDPAVVGHRGLVSAGTGLGEALLIWDPKSRQHHPLPSEGGHTDFAPRNDQEIALLHYLQRTLNGRVSYERVVSGIGIKNIYAFLRDDQKMEEPEWLRERIAKEDPNAVIGQCGEDGSSPICAEALKMFVSSYGAEAGNVALKVLAMGGIYLGGGIAPKIMKTMQNGEFVKAFLDKGRLSPLLHAVPVRIILDDTCALLGAAAYAEARAAELSGHSERAASTSS
ncbi:glucokinase [Bryocella elongata]|uniref:Glucokinase n=1 Tax=Bryocella elongata TaxID=863522 RepID=A0A1H6AH42_9BACT|nr:glucokinase [Bryocella elongata]SEG48089.1 glucokinase [Bryocella elongata]